jgi:hypothetical protein
MFLWGRAAYKPNRSGESGETQLGILLGGLLLGVLCWALFSLQSCIKTHKDSKVFNRRMQDVERYNVREPPRRGQQGYQVSY